MMRVPRCPAGLSLLGSLILAVLSLVSMGGSARAQAPPDSVVLRVGCTTDKPQYEPGEPIRIRVSATNPLDQPQTLAFPSSLQADYAIDDVYRWSDDRAFLTVVTSITLKPHETYVFPEFTHQPADYYVAAGRHRIDAFVGRYGTASAFIAVGGTMPPPAGLLLAPQVRPNPAPFGAPVALGVSVTNVSNAPLTFGHDGCPVRFTIDGYYTPPLACAEYWRQVTLEPGESIRFGPPDYPYLMLGGPESSFHLTPGWHSVEFEVPGVGRTSARFQVVGGGGSIAGTVMAPDGGPIQGARVQVVTYATSDSGAPPPQSGHFFHETRTDELGHYRFDDLAPALYFANSSNQDGSFVWWPGVPTREEATPIAVSEGSLAEGIDFVLHDGGPPPEYPEVISGTVFEALPPGSAACCPRPLAGAVVAAIPTFQSWVDSGFVPPGDSTSTDPRPPVSPPPPPNPPGPDGTIGLPVHYGFADSMGLFTIRVPHGYYRLIAFAQGHAYQWWDHVARFDEAQVWNATPHRAINPEIRFDLEPYLVRSLWQATIEGQVSGVSDDGHGEPPVPPVDTVNVRSHPAAVVPLAEADVVARPLVQDPRIQWFAPLVYPTRTDADGRYRLTVPSDVPYLVQSWARGHEPQYYDHAWGEHDAKPVDVRIHEVTGGINFDLYRSWVPEELGTITGVVYGNDPDDPTAQPTVIYPLPGALVRIRSAVPGAGPHEIVVMSGQDGSFHVDGLPMAADGSITYYVSAEAEGWIPVYFPQATHWMEATPVAPAPFGQATPLRLVVEARPAGGSHFLVGLVRADLGSGIETGWPPIDTPPPGGDSGGNGGAPDDTTGWGPIGSFWPLVGAYLYLVPADDPARGPVAGGVACDNGTVLVQGVAPGRYKAYADYPGFAPGWFHGTNRDDAAVIIVGSGGEAVVLDIVLVPTSGPPEPGAELDDAAPRMVLDLRNAPNPFRPQTTILYRLMSSADVTVQIFDLNGRLLRTLVDGERQPAGEQRLPWDGQDDSGRHAGAGIYFYRVWTPAETRTGKMVMLR